jgi:dynein intermediate chain 1
MNSGESVNFNNQPTDAELEQEIPPRVLTVADPRSAHNSSLFSLRDRSFKVSQLPRPLVIHMEIRGTLVPKQERIGADASSDVTSRDSGSALVDTVESSAFKNQFCFAERGAQTNDPIIYATGSSTRPPPSCDYNMSVCQSGIFDAYVPARGSSDSSIAASDGQDVIYSKAMKDTVKLMERMVNLNQELDAYMDFRFFNDEADTFRQIGTVLPLWRFACDKLKRKQVTCVKWSPQYSDLFAVSYGSYEFLKQASGGGVVIYSLKNPKFPELIVGTNCTACCLDFNPHRPAILAVGLYDGSVGVIDIRSSSRSLLFQTSHSKYKHSDPVWEVKWVSETSFVSVSVDGRVCTWSLKKSKLEPEILSELSYLVSEEELVSRNQLNGLCIDFSPHDPSTYLVGTEEGVIYMYSRVVSSTPLETFKSHTMAVYSVKWSPFHPEIFISSSADWNVNIWSTKNPTAPLTSLDLQQAVGDIDWSPTTSTVFAAVTADGSLSIYDIAVDRLNPILNQKILGKGKLTRVQFNPKEPVIVVGDDRGGTHCLKLSPNLRKAVKGDQRENLQQVAELLH